MQKLTGHEQTVIRGGYRIAYDPAYYNIFLNVATSAPVVNSGTINNVGLPSDLTGKGVQTAFLPLIPTGQNPGARNQTRVDPNFVNPYVEQWSFSIERQLSSKVSFETRYVGNHESGTPDNQRQPPSLQCIHRQHVHCGTRCPGSQPDSGKYHAMLSNRRSCRGRQWCTRASGLQLHQLAHSQQWRLVEI